MSFASHELPHFDSFEQQTTYLCCYDLIETPDTMDRDQRGRGGGGPGNPGPLDQWRHAGRATEAVLDPVPGSNEFRALTLHAARVVASASPDIQGAMPH